MIVKIKEIKPGSTYNGNVHTQYIIIELGDGTEMNIFDADKKCDEDMVNTCVGVELRGEYIQQIARVDNNVKEIRPDDIDVSNGIKFLRGAVVAPISGDKDGITVDFGEGNIELIPVPTQKEQFNSFSLGDVIEVTRISEVCLYNIGHKDMV